MQNEANKFEKSCDKNVGFCNVLAYSYDACKEAIRKIREDNDYRAMFFRGVSDAELENITIPRHCSGDYPKKIILMHDRKITMSPIEIKQTETNKK